MGAALSSHLKTAFPLVELTVEVMQRYSNFDSVSKTLDMLRFAGLIPLTEGQSAGPIARQG